MLKSTSYKRVR